MTRRLLSLCSFLLVAVAATAAAHGPYTVTKGALIGSQVDTGGTTVLRVERCQNLVAALPLFCGGGGFGAAIDVSRDANPVVEAPLETGATHHHHPYATGSCQVSQTGPGFGAAFVFSCGVDRNGDGLVTDAPVCWFETDAVLGVTPHDECSGEEAYTLDGVNEHWADDWVKGTHTSPTQLFCFQDDVRGFTATLLDDGITDVSQANQNVVPVEHGDGWDEILVFVGGDVPNTAQGAGVVAVTVTVSGASGCLAGNVSGHGSPGNPRTDGGAIGVGVEPCDLPALGFQPDCETPSCAELYRNGVTTTWPCPPELCGLPQGFAALTSRGPANGAAPKGALSCHDGSHATTGFTQTSVGSFDLLGNWNDSEAGPIVSGTHAHCNLTSLGAAEVAYVQCGKQ